jgi:prophage tail gpP-like protein
VDDITTLVLAASEGSGPGARAAERARRGHANGLNANDVEQLRLADAKPSVGETVWEFIDRHCRRFGLMPWMGADGQLIIGAPDYDQDPMYRLIRTESAPEAGRLKNTIVEGGIVYDWGSLSSAVTVFGRTQGNDASRSSIRATVDGPELPRLGIYRPMFLNDPSCRTAEQAARRAAREVANQREKFITLDYAVRDHGQGDHFYAIDTMAEVDDERLGLQGLWYVTRRTLNKSRDTGAVTRLGLVPSGAIDLTAGSATTSAGQAA